MNATFLDGSWPLRASPDQTRRRITRAGKTGAFLKSLARLPAQRPSGPVGSPAERVSDNPWDDPALWMLMMH